MAHADWGVDGNKRWVARGRRLSDGRWHAAAPVPVGANGSLLERMGVPAATESVVLGFDFPIGVPRAYAGRAGIKNFVSFLRKAGRGAWKDFFTVADRPEQISIRRPFYPNRALPKGTTRRSDLESGLGLSYEEMLRRCERTQLGRADACALFWTLGGNQVGKGAMSGWRLFQTEPPGTLAFWPFDGSLDELIGSRRVVVTETYPTEFAHHIGVGRVSGKRHQIVRRSHADALLGFAELAGLDLDQELRDMIAEGFGPSTRGEDPFDAVIGLFGMINVMCGRRPPNDPDDESVRSVEGWILGLAPIEPIEPGTEDAAPTSGKNAASKTSTTFDSRSRDDTPTTIAEDAADAISPAARTPSPLWAAEPPDANWLRQVLVLVEHAIDQLVLEFVALPYLHRVEHSLHCELYSLLTANRTLGRPYRLADGTWTQLVHKEWPETVVRPGKTGRGNFDMVVLDPDSLGQANIAQFQAGLVRPAVVIEIGLDYGSQHLRNDVAKLENSAIANSYVVHLARNPACHHPALIDTLDQPSVRVAAALAGAASPTYRLLQSHP